MSGGTSLRQRIDDVLVRAKQRNLGASLQNRVRARRGRPRRLLPNPVPGSRASSRRVNRMLPAIASSARYLEIGVDRGLTLETVATGRRTGVDPAPRFDTDRLPAGLEVYVGPSDQFFAGLDDAARFELVFADGLHQYEQTYRDVIDAFRHLAPRGLVLVDDVVPSDAVSAMRDLDASLRRRRAEGLPGQVWHGDVFRVLCVLRDHHPDLRFRTIVGSGNEQALIWNACPQVAVESVGPGVISGYADVSYEDVFSDGIPDWFGPGGEDIVITEALAAIADR